MLSLIKTRVLPTLAIAGVVWLPNVASAAATDFDAAHTLLSGWLGTLISLLIGIGLLVFIWGMVKFIGAGDDAGRSEGKTKMLWGIIILFVMVSIWGIVNFIDSSLDLDDTAQTAPEVPS